MKRQEVNYLQQRYPPLPLIYVLVLLGSLFIICAILGTRILLRNRSVRKFVRGVHQRIRSVEERDAILVEETPTEKPENNSRTSAIELQKVRSLVHCAEKTIARGNMEEAECLFIQALTINPEAHNVRAELAKLYLTTNRYPKAEAMYKDILQNCDDVSFHANLGLAYYNQKKYVEACRSYQEALDRDPNNPERSASLGRACIAAHRFEEASVLLEKASTRLSRETGILHLLAECYVQLGDNTQALETYKRINKLEPYDEIVKEKLVALTES